MFKNTGAIHKRINTIKINYNTTRTKICYISNRRQQIVREHTTSADEKEYFDDSIFRYSFTKLIYEITVFPITSTLAFYLISLMQCLSESSVKRARRLFQSKGSTSYQISKLFLVLVNNEKKTQNLSVNKPKK